MALLQPMHRRIKRHRKHKYMALNALRSGGEEEVFHLEDVAKKIKEIRKTKGARPK